MKKILILIILFSFLIIPVSAMEFTAPSAPESAKPYMPENQETFAQGLWYILKTAISKLRPELTNASNNCFCVIAAVLLMSVLNSFSKYSETCIRLVGAVVIGILLLDPFHSLIQLSTNTVNELTDYGKLLLPVMTAAMAAHGGISASAALYTGTVFFNALLATVISKFIIPALYIYLCLSIANCAIEQDMLKKSCDFVKWITTWCLKTVLYVFTGYISITGVISGAVDASTLKAAKMTISGVVPVVGKILSDATETILVSAEVMKSAAGVYGVLAIISICISPFLQVGAQYLLLKLSGAVCNMFGYKPAVTLLGDFTTGMGFILAMTGSVCMLLLISLVCFLRGIGV